MTDTRGSISADLNFLLLPGAPPFPGRTTVTYESLVQWFCGHSVSPALSDILARFAQLPNNASFIAPAEPRILTKLAYPLRNAKACYMLGNYLATVALCGFVAEMSAVLLLELSQLDVPDAKKKNFDRPHQSQRIEHLERLGILNAKAKQHLEDIRTTRNRYLHVWSEDHDRLPADAARVFDAAVSLVAFTLGLSFSKPGHLALRPELVRYLEQHGVYTPPTPPAKAHLGSELLGDGPV